jgi:hypothetical protein
MKHISMRTLTSGHPQRSVSSAEGYDSSVVGILVIAKLFVYSMQASGNFQVFFSLDKQLLPSQGQVCSKVLIITF